MRNNGFTLIEVLVASVILFSVITSVSLIYRGALLSSAKAQANIQIANVMPIAIKQIRFNIRARTTGSITELNGNNTFWGVGVTWRASRINFAAPPPLYDIDSNQEQEQANKYFLWHVEAQFLLHETTKKIEFKEVSWNEL